MEFIVDYNLLRYISFLGGTQGIILSLLVLFYPKKYLTSNSLLFAFLASLTLIIWAPRLNEVIPTLYMWPIVGVRFTALMFLYWYIKNLYNPIDWKNEWWNVPLLLVHLVLSYLEYADPISFIEKRPSLFVVSLLADTGTIILYFALLFQCLNAYKIKLETHFSSEYQLGYQWSKELVWFFLGITIYQALVVIFKSISWMPEIVPYLGIVNTLIFTVYMYFIAIKGKLTPEIYQMRRIPENEAIAPFEKEIIDHQKDTTLPDPHLVKIANRASKLMQENKSYLNPTLTLQEFSDQLEAKSYLVSQAINQVLHQTFFDMVNTYRVEEAKELLLNPKLSHLSILGIGYEAGFNSKTTFNTTFKKVTGLTPTAYKLKFEKESGNNP